MPLQIKKNRRILLIASALLIGAGLLYAFTAYGVTRTWDGGGGDANWNTAANWSGDTIPGVSDIASFDGTCVSNCSPTINVAISVAGINMAADYAGTITQSTTNTITVGSSHWVQAAGTFTGGSGSITVNGTFTLSGGTFTSTTGTLQVGRYTAIETFFTVSGGTFTHNSGTVKFAQYYNGNCSDTKTVNVVTSLTLYDIIIDTGGGFSDCITAASGDTIIAANDFTISRGAIKGSWEFQGNLTIGATAVSISYGNVPGTLTYTGTGSKTYTYTTGGVGPSLRLNTASGSLTANTGTTDLSVDSFSLLAGTFTAPTGTMTVGHYAPTETFFNIASGATFTHNSGTVKFDQYYNGNCSDVKTIDVATSLTLYNIIVDTSSFGDCIRVASGDTLIATNDLTITGGAIMGTWEVQGNVTIGTGADAGSGTISYTGTNDQTYTDQGGNEPDGDITINKTSGTVTLASNADWNATSQDLIITSGTLSSATYNITTVNFTVNGGTFTGGSGTVTTTGPLVVSSGTFTGGAGNITVSNTFTLSGGTFTSTSGTLQIGRTVHSDETIMNISGGTFTHNSGTVKFVSGGDYSKTYTVNVQTSLTLYDIVWDQGYNNLEIDYLTTAAGDTVIAANNFTHTNGHLSGTWEVQGNVIIASTADGGAGTLTMTGTGSKTYTYSSSGSGPHLRVNNASISVAANAGTTSLNVHYFSLLAGTFTAPSGTMTINPSVSAANSVTRFLVSDGTFNHNNGTVAFATYVSSSFAETSVINVATSLTLYNIIVNATTYSSAQIPTISVTSGDTLIAANDLTFSDGSMAGAWEVQNNVVIGSGADGGSGTLTYTGSGSKTYSYTAGGIAPHLRVNNADVSVSPLAGTTSLTTLLFSLLAGTFTAPTGTMTIGRTVHGSENTLVVSGGTFNHNNGTVKFVSGGDYAQTYTIDVATSLTLYNVEWNQGYNNAENDYLTTAAGDTIIVANDFTYTNGILSGTWQVQGNVVIASTADGGTATLTFTGPNDQTYTDQGGNEPNGDVTINKTSGTVTLASNADWNATSQDLTITSGILSMGSTYNITTTALTVSTGGVLLNSGTGDLTLGGNVANAGRILMQRGSCANTDSVLIRSSVAGTQRSWSGAGTFTLTDVDIKDMAGSASITAYSSTNTGNNGVNWTFDSGCVALPAAASFPSSKFTFPSGKVNFR